MRKRSSKKPVVSELVPAESALEPSPPAKNPAAVALGKLGGAKGGAARAKKLTAEGEKVAGTFSESGAEVAPPSDWQYLPPPVNLRLAHCLHNATCNIVSPLFWQGNSPP